jgi:CrcB protein
MISMALAGACGAIVRYLIELTGINAKASTSPWLTMFANVAGSLVAGFTVHTLVIAGGVVITSNLVNGFCGGLTTFSSAFAIPTLFEKRDKSYGWFLIVLTPVLCSAAFIFAMSMHR